VSEPRHASHAELEALLDTIRAAPRDSGPLEMIVRRPATGEREMLAAARLTVEEGLVGDRWLANPTRQLGEQIAVMCSRAIAAFAGPRERWPLAGDQLYVDLDLSVDNLPAGTRLAVGTAVLEVSAEPHLGCRKFRARYGHDAMRFTLTEVGRALRVRGANATVVVSGDVALGDVVRKL
jgi:hypothetical protein